MNASVAKKTARRIFVDEQTDKKRVSIALLSNPEIGLNFKFLAHQKVGFKSMTVPCVGKIDRHVYR